MKKLISFITAIAACVSLTACSSTPENSDIFAEVELVRTGMANRMVIEDLEKLEKYNEIAVVGEFIDDPVSDITYEYSAYFGKDIITFFESRNTIEVKQVLKGDVNVGDELTLGQYCGIEDGKLYTISDLTPMQKGDEWVFFLHKVDTNLYWCIGDSAARYPTKTSAARNSRLAFADSWQLGVYDEADFRQDIYNEIVEKYDV